MAKPFTDSNVDGLQPTIDELLDSDVLTPDRLLSLGWESMHDGSYWLFHRDLPYFGWRVGQGMMHGCSTCGWSKTNIKTGRDLNDLVRLLIFS